MGAGPPSVRPPSGRSQGRRPVRSAKTHPTKSQSPEQRHEAPGHEPCVSGPDVDHGRPGPADDQGSVPWRLLGSGCSDAFSRSTFPGFSGRMLPAQRFPHPQCRSGFRRPSLVGFIWRMPNCIEPPVDVPWSWGPGLKGGAPLPTGRASRAPPLADSAFPIAPGPSKAGTLGPLKHNHKQKTTPKKMRPDFCLPSQGQGRTVAAPQRTRTRLCTAVRSLPIRPNRNPSDEALSGPRKREGPLYRGESNDRGARRFLGLRPPERESVSNLKSSGSLAGCPCCARQGWPPTTESALARPGATIAAPAAVSRARSTSGGDGPPVGPGGGYAVFSWKARGPPSLDTNARATEP